MARTVPDRARFLGAAVLLALLGVATGLLIAQRERAAAPAPDRFRGHLAAGRPAMFIPCGDRQVRPLLDATGGRLAQIAEREAGIDPPPLYVEALGREEAGGTIVLTDVRYAARETAGCRSRLDDVIVRALGNEPFWAVTVTPSEIRFEAPDHTPVTFPPAAPQAQADGRAYEVEGSGGARLHLELWEAACSDGMSDAYYALTAAARIDGVRFEGCAREGWR